MRNIAKFLALGAFALFMLSGETRTQAQAAPGQAPAPAQQQPQQQPQPQRPTFSVQVDLVTTDVIVRDGRTDQFISDLKPGELEVYEDGVKQEISSLTLVNGGRVFNVQAPPPPPSPEGIILPPVRPTNDASGRVFLLFIDDLHLDFQSTPRTRQLIQRMLRSLIHDGDMFGIVTTGTSSISQQLTYDRQVLESAISRITGGGLRPDDIVKGQQGSQGPSELRYRAHVAFSTAYELMKNLEQLRNRRKAVLYISSGYDFNPFETSRLKAMGEMMRGENGEAAKLEDLRTDPFIKSQLDSQNLAEADLIRELGELTRAANRANATLYTIDPRGLVAGPDVDQTVETQEWLAYIRDTQDSLRVLAEETGGIAVVNQNDFDKALKRIDAETSDYYVLGYYSSNPDPLRRTRRLEVKTTRPGVNVWSRTSYSLRPLPPPVQ
jgi:VWFA-related protein